MKIQVTKLNHMTLISNRKNYSHYVYQSIIVSIVMLLTVSHLQAKDWNTEGNECSIYQQTDEFQEEVTSVFSSEYYESIEPMASAMPMMMNAQVTGDEDFALIIGTTDFSGSPWSFVGSTAISRSGNALNLGSNACSQGVEGIEQSFSTVDGQLYRVDVSYQSQSCDNSMSIEIFDELNALVVSDVTIGDDSFGTYRSDLTNVNTMTFTGNGNTFKIRMENQPGNGGFTTVESLAVLEQDIAPGGVTSDLHLWMKADEGAYSDAGTTAVSNGDYVQEWHDQSPAAWLAQQQDAIDNCQYLENETNFNPIIRFDQNTSRAFELNGDLFTDTDLPAIGIEAFYVMIPRADANNNAYVMMNGTTNNNRFYLTGSGGRWGSIGWGASTSETGVYMVSTQYDNLDGDGTGSATRSINGGTQDTKTGNDWDTHELSQPWAIGHHSQGNTTGRRLDGDLTELIIYSGLNPSKRLQIQSYLALKYGITLDQTSAQDYLASNGLEMWDASDAAAGFNQNIFGIGSDTQSGLIQSISRSVNQSGIMTLSTTPDFSSANDGSRTALPDFHFQTIAHDAGNENWTATDAPANAQILGRKWQAYEQGSVGYVHFSFDTQNSNFNVEDPYAGTSKYYLVVDSDNDGSFNDESLINLSSNGTNWSGGYNFLNGQLFTLATSTQADIDNDGVADAIENAAPNSGDANDDGTLDSQQSNVASIPNAQTGDYISLVTTGCNDIINLAATTENELPMVDNSKDYDYGLVDFQLQCANSGDLTSVDIYWHGINTTEYGIRKYGSASPGVNSPYYYDKLSSQNLLTIDGTSVLRTSYNLEDGAFGDEDPTAAFISDPVGLVSNPPEYPGGVSTNLNLWLKVDAETYSDGDPVTSWTDVSMNGGDMTPHNAPRTPNFKSSETDANFNPYIDFDRTTSDRMNGKNYELSGEVSYQMFFVFNQEEHEAGQFPDLWDWDGFHNQERIEIFNNQFQGTSYNVPASTGQWNIGVAGATTGTVTSRANGYSSPITGSFSLGMSGNSNVSIGTNGQLNADIAEIIYYTEETSGLELQKIESYLALKYGITLDQSLANGAVTTYDYIASDGTTVFNAPDNSNSAAYNKNIIGIGRDDISGLDQRVSSSSESGRVISVALDNEFTALNNSASRPTAHANDIQYLTIANNGATNSQTEELDASAGFLVRSSREWQVQKTTNFTQDISLKFEGYDELWSLISTPDGDFSTGVSVVGSLDANGEITGFTPTDGSVITLASNATYPGGAATDLSLWLKADVGGAAWTDLSGNNHPLTTNGDPTTGLNTMNFNPTVEFDGTGDSYTVSDSHKMGGTNDFSIISVLTSNQTTQQAFISSTGSSPNSFFYTNNTARIHQNGVGDIVTGSTNIVDNTPRLIDAQRSGNEFELFIDGISDLASAVTSSVNFTATPDYNIGQLTGLADFNGDIAEIIIYDNDISAENRQKIQSYLALKYGISLNQSLANATDSLGDYLASDNTVVFDAHDGTAVNAYNKNIFGIAKDLFSGLDQQISKSVDTGSILTVSTDTDLSTANGTHTSLSDLQFLIIGDDGGDPLMSTSTESLDGTAGHRIDREWKLTNTNGVEQASFKFDGFDAFSAIVFDDDGDFSSGTQTRIGLDQNGEAHNVDLTLHSGQYFTVMDQRPFITEWTVTPGDLDIFIPTHNTGYNYTVDWGDGTVETGISTLDYAHTYADDSGSPYEVKITGTFPRMFSDATHSASDQADIDNMAQLHSIKQWGDINWKFMNNAFGNAINASYEATDYPELSDVTSLDATFNRFGDLNGADFSNWDVSQVTDMRGAFAISGGSFTGLENWDVSKVTRMTMMFRSTDFDGDISNWDVSQVIAFDQMFRDNSSFDQDISNWNVSAANSFNNMFLSAVSFNQNLGNWERTFGVDGATSSSTVSGATDFTAVFRNCQTFNQDLSSWDLSSAESTASMFQNALLFNHSIENWNTPLVTDMNQMFSGALLFNQDLSGLEMGLVSDATNMLNNCGLSIANYDNTLIGWNSQTLQNTVTLGASGLNFCLSSPERNNMMSANSWSFIGDSEDCTPAPGGISNNLHLWLNANSVPLGNLVDNTGWEDQSGNNYHIEHVNGAPVVTENGLNFNQSVVFDGIDYLRDDNQTIVGGLSAGEVFTVVKDNNLSGSNGHPFDLGGHSGSHYSFNNQAIYDDFGTNDRFGINPTTGVILDAKAGVTVGTTGFNTANWNLYGLHSATNDWAMFMNGATVASTSTNVTNFTGAEHIGARAGLSWNGEIPEIVMYDRVLSSDEKQRVNSYFALKYGLTLDSGQVNYIASDNTIIWESVGAGMFTNDIFGIGRDSLSCLDQKVSKSVSSDAIMTLAVDDDFTSPNQDASRNSLANLHFQTIANNGGANSWTSADAPTDYAIIGRQWQANEQGTVGTVYFAFNTDNSDFDLPTPLIGTDYYLLVDAAGDGFANDNPIVLTDEGNGIWAGSFDFSSGQIFTIATQADQDGDGLIETVDRDDDNDGLTDDAESACGVINVDFSDLNNIPDITVMGETVSVTASASGEGTVTGQNDGDMNFINSAVTPLGPEIKLQFSKPVKIWLGSKSASTGNWFSNTDEFLVSSDGNRFTVSDPDNDITALDGDTIVGPISFTGTSPSNPFNEAWNITSDFSTTYRIKYTNALINGSAIKVVINCIQLDSDGDGTPNHLDRDSDADGCADALEGNGTFTFTDLLADSSLTILSVDAAGIPTMASGGQNDISSKLAEVSNCLDSDGDELADAIDHDDDNDGITDSDEGGMAPVSTSVITWQTDNNLSILTPTDSTIVPDAVDGVWESALSDQRYSLPIELVYSHSGTGNSMFGLSPEGTNLNTNWTINSAFGWQNNMNGSRHRYNNTLFSAFYANTSGLEHRITIDENGQATWYLDGAVIYSQSGLPTSEYRLYLSNASNVDALLTYTVHELNSGGSPMLYTQDTDNDDTPDAIDRDSDGDDCPDALEANGGFSFIQLAADSSLTNLLAEVDSIGIPLVTPGGQSSISAFDSSTDHCTDSDEDGLADVLDRDSDNDGLLDSLECASTFEPIIGASGTLSNTTSDYSVSVSGGTINYFANGDFDINASTGYPSPEVIIEFTEPVNVKISPTSDDHGFIWQDLASYAPTLFSTNGSNWTRELGTTGNAAVTLEGQDAIGTTNNTISSNNNWGSIASQSVTRLYLLEAGSGGYKIEAAPCPDTDSDGELNYLDLDSDDDTCPDALEGDGGFIASQLENDTLTGGVDNFGIPILASGGQNNVSAYDDVVISCEDQVAPGGISSNLALWLKADTDVTGGATVTQWNDQSGNDHHFTTSGAQSPDATNGEINFNQSVYFDGTNDLMQNTTGNAYGDGSIADASFFGVYTLEKNGATAIGGTSGTDLHTRITHSTGQTFADAASNPGINRVGNAGGINASEYGTPYLFGFNHQTTGSTYQEITKNGEIIVSDNTAMAFNGPSTCFLGSSLGGTAELLQGNLAEVVVYPTLLNPTERQKIESYLALKYGITLDQSTPQNYLASDENVLIWDTTGVSLFNNNIFGIGRDSLSCLNQKVAVDPDFTSSNTDASRDSLLNMHFQTIANNGGDTLWTATDAPEGYEILDRQWMVQETGTVGTVNFAFDVNDAAFDVADLISGTDYYIIIDEDDNGFADETPAALTLDGGLWTGSLNKQFHI